MTIVITRLERFGPAARRLVGIAESDADSSGHAAITLDHLALAVMSLPGAIPADARRDAEVLIDAAHQRLRMLPRSKDGRAFLAHEVLRLFERLERAAGEGYVTERALISHLAAEGLVSHLVADRWSPRPVNCSDRLPPTHGLELRHLGRMLRRRLGTTQSAGELATKHLTDLARSLRAERIPELDVLESPRKLTLSRAGGGVTLSLSLAPDDAGLVFQIDDSHTEVRRFAFDAEMLGFYERSEEVVAVVCQVIASRLFADPQPAFDGGG